MKTSQCHASTGQVALPEKLIQIGLHAGLWSAVGYAAVSPAFRFLCDQWCDSQPLGIGNKLNSQVHAALPTYKRSGLERQLVSHGKSDIVFCLPSQYWWLLSTNNSVSHTSCRQACVKTIKSLQPNYKMPVLVTTFVSILLQRWRMPTWLTVLL